MTCTKCGKGFLFTPEYGEERCSNVGCDWNEKKRNLGILRDMYG